MEIQQIAAKLRKVSNLSAFARSANVGRATLYRVMGGWCNPTWETLRRIERELQKGKA